MMDFVFAGSSLHPELHQGLVEFADSVIGCHGRGFGECATMGVFEHGALLGVVVFHNWQPEAGVIEISGASTSRRWLSRPMLERMFIWAFDERGCQLVAARVSDDNKRLHRILHAYGFKSFVIPRLRGRGEDERVFTLTDDDWRGGKFHKR